jgi:hypothetical protein
MNMAKRLKSNQVIVKSKDETTHAANCALSSSVSASVVIADFSKSAFGELDLSALIENLTTKMGAVKAGDMSACENMLLAQANALQSMFMNMARRAHTQEQMPHIEGFMRLALKAQNQCRATIETLAAIKNPPIIYAKQANISNGHQQINNGTPARVEKDIQPNELLSEGRNYAAMECGGTGAAIPTDKAMETVGV